MMILGGGDDSKCAMKRSSSWLFISLLRRGVLRQLHGLTPLGGAIETNNSEGVVGGRERMTSPIEMYPSMRLPFRGSDTFPGR